MKQQKIRRYAGDPPRVCTICGADMTHRRNQAMTCSVKCRVAAHRFARALTQKLSDAVPRSSILHSPKARIKRSILKNGKSPRTRKPIKRA